MFTDAKRTTRGNFANKKVVGQALFRHTSLHREHSGPTGLGGKSLGGNNVTTLISTGLSRDDQAILGKFHVSTKNRNN